MTKGVELKVMRIRKKKKALDVSKTAGISASKLSLIENGYKECSQALYEKLVDIISQ